MLSFIFVFVSFYFYFFSSISYADVYTSSGALPKSGFVHYPHFTNFVPENGNAPTAESDPNDVFYCPRGCLQFFDGCDVCTCAVTGIVLSCMKRPCPLIGRGPTRCIYPNNCVIKDCLIDEPRDVFCASDGTKYFSVCQMENIMCKNPFIYPVKCPTKFNIQSNYTMDYWDENDQIYFQKAHKGGLGSN